MKLNREIVDLLKLHGFITVPASTDSFLAKFDTLESLGDAGFISDRAAFEFVKNVFDDNGKNQPATVDNLEEQAVEEPVNEVVSKPATEVEKPTEESVTETPVIEEKPKTTKKKTTKKKTTEKES